ncbi:MAG: CRISPR-associated endonuclease Cas1 [Bacteroidales bacterium]|nr:CRISPR-associated endonuclease Cas1 [Bacteroidales bacterium]
MDLILNTFGTSLLKENDNLIIIHKDGKQKIHPEKIKSIIIGRGAQISSDATILAINHQIDIFFVDRAGDPVGRVWSVKYGSVTTIRRQQLDFTFSNKATEWIKKIIAEKIGNQIAIILSFAPGDEYTISRTETAIRKLNDYKTKVENITVDIISEISRTLRGWEGASGRVYFETLNLFLPEQFKSKGRSQHPATDPINCLLNYGYGILYGKIESALVKAGVDPYIGIFHREDYNRPVLVFDIIEKFRVWVDYVVLTLIIQEAIDEECYSVKEDGSYWLEGLGKRILIQSLNDYMEEIITLNGLERSRLNHIQMFAHSVAKMFMNFKNASDNDNGRKKNK